MMDKEQRNLIPGRKYRIELEDCCIEGELTGTFIEWDDDDYYACFDIGNIGPDWGKWRATEVEKP